MTKESCLIGITRSRPIYTPKQRNETHKLEKSLMTRKSKNKFKKKYQVYKTRPKLPPKIGTNAGEQGIEMQSSSPVAGPSTE